MSHKVAVLMGSGSDRPVMEKAGQVLEEFGITHDTRVLSAHKTPDETLAFASEARDNGFEVIICGAGKAAHLAGVVAAKTTLPVIGVPLSASLDGLDALRDEKNMGSILIGHVKTKEFNDPESDPYTTYMFDINEKAANAVYRWADLVAFCNFKRAIVTKTDAGFNKTRSRAKLSRP